MDLLGVLSFEIQEERAMEGNDEIRLAVKILSRFEGRKNIAGLDEEKS